MMLQSVIDATLVARAAGRDFDRLAAAYGFTRPFYVPRWAWRQAVLAGVFGRRCSAPTLWAFFEGALAPWSRRLTGVYSAGALSGDWTAADVGRVVRLEGSGLVRVTSLVSPTLVNVTPVGRASEPGEYQLSVLAWVMQEREPCTVEVLVWGQDYPAVPPTYLREDGEARPPLEPKGGILLEDVRVDAGLTKPAYLSFEGAFREIQEVAASMLIPAGFRLQVTRLEV